MSCSPAAPHASNTGARTGGLKPTRRSAFPVLVAAIGSLVFARTGYSADPALTLFENHCIPCHGADGKARTPAGKKLGAKDLSESKLVDAEIEKQIRDGSKDKRGAEKMPPFREKLTPPDIQTLVGYVKTFRTRK